MAALAALTRAEKTLERRREEFARAIADAIREGVKPAVLVQETEKSSETIRTAARKHGVEPLRDPRGAAKAAARQAAERAGETD